ncbi:MAG: DUF4369 domain-containing protein [Fulvivirga sp.]
MKVLNKLFYYLSIAMLFFGCDSNTIEINGEVDGATSGTIYLYKLDPNNVYLVDSFNIRNNAFSYSLSNVVPDLYELRVHDKRVKVFLNNEDVTVKIDGLQKYSNTKVESRDHSLLDSVYAIKNDFENSDRYRSYVGAFRKARILKDTSVSDSLRNLAKTLLLERNTKIKKFLSLQEPAVSMVLVTRLLNDPQSNQFKRELASQLLHEFPTSMQVRYLGKKEKIITP